MATIKTNVFPLFGSKGQFYCTATWKYVPNENTRKFTVTVTGVRGYCKYGWNFQQHIYVGIGSTPDNARKNAKYIHIPASGNNAYEGWLPKSGDLSVNVSETFNYDDWGNPSSVYIYLRDYNHSIQWIVANRKTSLDVSANENVTGNITKIKVKDNTPPTIDLSASSSNGVNWNYSVTSNYQLSSLNTTIDGRALPNQYSGSVKVTNGVHTFKAVGVKKANGLSGYATKEIDSALPTIKSASLLVNSSSTALLTFEASHNVDYRVQFSDGTYYPASSWASLNAKSLKSKQITIPKDQKCTAKLIVRRVNNGKYSYFTSLKCNKSLGDCDSVLPKLNSYQLSVTGNNIGRLTSTSSHNINYKLSLDNKLVENISNNKINRIVNLPLDTKSKFTVTIYRKDNTTLSNVYEISYDTLLPKFNITNLIVYLDKVTFKVNNLTSLPIEVTALGNVIKLAPKKTERVTVKLSRSYNEDVIVTSVRQSNDKVNYSSAIYVDNRQVKAKNCLLLPKTKQTGDLSATFYNITKDIPWKCELLYDGNVIDNKDVFVGKGPAVISKILNVIEDVSDNYQLRITRRDNSNLVFTSNYIPLDSRYPSDYITVIETYKQRDGSYSLTDGLFSYNPPATKGRDMDIDYVKITGKQLEKKLNIPINPRIFTYYGSDITKSKNKIILPNIFNNDILLWTVTLRHNKNKFSETFSNTTDARYPEFNISLGQTYGSSQDIVVNPTRPSKTLSLQYKRASEYKWKKYSQHDTALAKLNNIYTVSNLVPGDRYNVRVQGSFWNGKQSSKLYNTSDVLTFTAQGGAYMGRNTIDNKRVLAPASMYVYYPEKDQGDKWLFIAPYVYTENCRWEPLC